MRIHAMVAVAALCLGTATSVVIAPAAHGDDVLTTVTEVSVDRVCPLRRVGHRLVRCDNRTGAMAEAPAHVLEYPGPE